MCRTGLPHSPTLGPQLLHRMMKSGWKGLYLIPGILRINQAKVRKAPSSVPGFQTGLIKFYRGRKIRYRVTEARREPRPGLVGSFGFTVMAYSLRSSPPPGPAWRWMKRQKIPACTVFSQTRPQLRNLGELIPSGGNSRRVMRVSTRNRPPFLRGNCLVWHRTADRVLILLKPENLLPRMIWV